MKFCWIWWSAELVVSAEMMVTHSMRVHGLLKENICTDSRSWQVADGPQWKLALSRTEFFWVGLSWTEYADDLGLCQKMSFFQMKSEIVCNESEWLISLFPCDLCPTAFCRTPLRVSEAFLFRKIHIIYCSMRSMSEFIWSYPTRFRLLFYLSFLLWYFHSSGPRDRERGWRKRNAL
jgi:hypothetical protein